MSSLSSVRGAHRAGKITLFVLWAAFAAVAYNIYSEVQELALIDHLEALDEAAPYDDYDAQTLDRLEANEQRQLYAAIGYIGALFISSLFLLIWVSRTNRACRDLGAKYMQFTPGWAWGYWLIPILNLFRPFQIVRELWTTTDANGKSSALVGWWWAAWLVSGFVARFAARAQVDSTLEEIRDTDHWMLFSHGLDIVGLALTIALVTKLSANLKSYQERVSPPAVRIVSHSED